MAHSMLRHKDNGSSPSGKAQDFDSCTRWFESSWPSYGRVAQVVEHLTFNQVVRGSNPRTLTYLVPWFSVGLNKCGCGGTGRRARLRIQSLRGAGSSPVIRIQLNIIRPVIYRSNRGTFTKKVSFFAFFMDFKEKAEKEKKKQYLNISVENIRIEIVSFTDSNYMLI